MLETAVILNQQEDLYAISALFFFVMRHQINSTCYTRAKQIERHRHFDFLLVGDLQAIEEVIEVYGQGTVPPMILLIPPQTVVDYPLSVLRIIPIIQSNLDVMDVTLQFDEFVWAVETLTGQKLH